MHITISTKTRLTEKECAKKKQPRPWEHMAYRLSDTVRTRLLHGINRYRGDPFHLLLPI